MGRPYKPNSLRRLFGAEYQTWRNLRVRCNGEGPSGYYKDRGITVCQRWQLSFDEFLSDMGPRPAGPKRYWSIERVDNSKGYCPENCRWATPKEQAANRSARKLKPHVVAALKLRRRGYTVTQIATKLNLRRAVVNGAVYNHKGKHV